MLSSIFEVLKNIGEFFTTVFEIVVKLVKDIIYVVTLLVDLLPNMSSFLGWLPASVIALIVALLAIVVIYKVLGRD